MASILTLLIDRVTTVFYSVTHQNALERFKQPAKGKVAFWDEGRGQGTVKKVLPLSTRNSSF